MIKLLINNTRIERLTCKNIYSPSDCEELFDGGFEINSNGDLAVTEDNYALILESGLILYDWTKHEYYDNNTNEEVIYIMSGGNEYNEDDIIYEVDPKELNQTPKTARYKAPIFATIDGGRKSYRDSDTPGMRLIRENMRAHGARTKKLYSERQTRNKRVK